ncbi:unnamed protein product [Triticum turgidum subsp. durum]|uniref:pyridoxal 5'-phosphate synthase (glutamine hydrolyzing) n=1 Tax=Triticum turgidum subsp. durum TaxID=4567 RepID=A0A9R0SGL0_TRITD|nr:unnamed protein product [Triticum turgidum subsp. durum]
MASDGVVALYGNNKAVVEPSAKPAAATFSVKVGLAQMLRGGVIMDVVTAEQALRRIREGAAMIHTKGEAGTGNVVEAVRHVRSVMGAVRALRNMDEDEVFSYAKQIAAPYDLVMQTKQLGRLPVVQFAAGGVATPADAALMMQLGCDGVFVGSGIFKSGDPARRARAIVQAVTHYSDPEILANVSAGLGEAMVGINLSDPNVERFAARSQ